jgi:hypothetical protein
MKERPIPICFWSYNTGREAKSGGGPTIDPKLQEGTTPLVKKMDGRLTRNFRNFHHPRVTEQNFAGAKAILQEWWSGEGPGPGTWRFNLKAEADDVVGRSFAVHVPNDAGWEDQLRRFVADARAGRPTKVFVSGRPFTFDAPTQARDLTGLYLELESSREIRLAASDRE